MKSFLPFKRGFKVFSALTLFTAVFSSSAFAYTTKTLTSGANTYTVAFISNQLYSTCSGPITQSPWWGDKPLAIALATQLAGDLGRPLINTYGPMFAYQSNASSVGNSAWNDVASRLDTSDTGWPIGSPGVWAVDPSKMDTNCPTSLLQTAVVAPKITSITPSSGTTAGGTVINITGTDLTGATDIKVDATSCTSFSVTSDTSATCTTPSGTAGQVSVLVTTSSGTNAANSLFTYVVPVAGPETIPTLSEWAMLFLASLMGMFAIVSIRRKN